MSRQSELLACLPTSLKHKEFRLMSRLNSQNELARLPDAICPLTCYQSKVSKIEKVPRGILGDKSSLRNLVSTIGTQATFKKGKRKLIRISRYRFSVIVFFFYVAFPLSMVLQFLRYSSKSSEYLEYMYDIFFMYDICLLLFLVPYHSWRV